MIFICKNINSFSNMIRLWRNLSKLFSISAIILFIGFLGLLISSVLLTSCSDDPVTPPVAEFDPPRFNWRSLDIPLIDGFAGIWAKDTNNIFMINYYNKTMYHISNGNINIYNVGNYGLNEIEGVSENEVYLFGAVPFPDNILTLIKWNGGGFEYYPTGIIVNSGPAIRGCIVNSNEVWIGSENGISKFDGINMTNYTIENSPISPVDLFLSNDNKIQLISGSWIDTNYIQQSIYEFQDTGFIKIYDKISSPYPNWAYTYLKQIGGNKIGMEITQNALTNTYTICFDYFIDTSFTPYFCLNNKINYSVNSPSNNPVGTNTGNFILLTQSSERIFEPPSKVGIVHWNGSKLSKEIGLAPSSFPSHYIAPIVFCINPSNYLVFEPHSFNNDIPTLYIGTKK